MTDDRLDPYTHIFNKANRTIVAVHCPQETKLEIEQAARDARVTVSKFMCGIFEWFKEYEKQHQEANGKAE